MELVVLTQNGCAPCEILKKFLTEKGVPFKPINLSESPEFAEHYGIMGTPVTVLEEDGEEIARVNKFSPEDIMDLAEAL